MAESGHTITNTNTKALLTTPNPFEQRFGYHRAVRRGPMIFVSGTTALKLVSPAPPFRAQEQAPPLDQDHTPGIQLTDSTVTAIAPTTNPWRTEGTNLPAVQGPETPEPAVEYPNDAFKQSLLSMARAISAVQGLGGRREDICRVRMFVARAQDCGDVGRAYRECFGTPVDDVAAPGGGVEEKVLWKEDVVGAAATMIVVGETGFVDGGILVEVEVEAFVV